MDLKVLITGADGFIGSHLVEYLLDKGYSVKAFCIYNSQSSLGWLEYLPMDKKNEIDFFLGDIRDPQCVREAMKGVDIVFHLAALIAIPYSYIAPSSYVATNINGTLNILQSAKDLDVSKVIHTSTSEVYGTAQYVPIDENHPLVGQSPYSASKIGADQLAISYYKSFNTPVTILRPFNTYGPRQSNRAVIPTIISQIASNNKYIKLGTLTPTRDFNYVLDTCAAFESLARADENCLGKIINSSSNYEISIGDTAKLICKLMNSDLDIITDEVRFRPEKSEVNRLFGDNSLIKSITDWKPKYSGIEGFSKGLEMTIEWFSKKENIDLYKTNKYIV